MNSFKIFPAIKESIKIAYKYKFLWVFALMLSGFSVGSNMNMFNNLNSKETDSKKDQIIETSFNYINNLVAQQKATSNNLLAATDLGLPKNDATSIEPKLDENAQPNQTDLDAIPPANAANSGETMEVSSKNFIFLQAMQILYLTPPEEILQLFKGNLITIGIIAFFGITFAVLVGLVIKAWTLGALLVGTKYAVDNEDLKLNVLASSGTSNSVALVRFHILMALTFLIVTFVFGVFGVSPFVFFPNSSIPFLLGFLIGFVYMIFFISFIYISKIGPYFIVFQGKRARESFYAGWEFFKMNFKKAILTDITSFIFVGLITGVILAILGAVFYVGVLLYPSTVLFLQEHFALIIPLSMFLSILMLAIIFAFMAYSGLMITFKNVLWTKMFFALSSNVPNKGLEDSNKMEVANAA